MSHKCASAAPSGGRGHIGYRSPLEAMKEGPREKLAYISCISAKWETTRQPDFLATVDLDPESETYSTVVHKLEMPHLGDELHHTGWNACSSCRLCDVQRNRLLVPGLNSDRIYVVDTQTESRRPSIHKVIEPENVHKARAGAPHTIHCLPSGEIMISCMGDAEGKAKGTFLLLDQNFDVKGTWQSEADSAAYNYDYWYQPRHNVMVSTEWAAPNTFRRGFDLEDVQKGRYGHSITFWDWKERKPIQRLDLGEKGQIPLEVRFLHDPDAKEGFVGCALSTSVFHFKRSEQAKKWSADCVLVIPTKKVKNWMLPEMPGLITDILISLDDRFLYVSNWVHGDIRQYDISDTSKPRCVGQIFLGGSICKGEKVEVLEDPELLEQPSRPSVRGLPIRGGPQMLQLSLDGKRLYVTNSLFSSWDRQFYPENVEQGSMMVMVHVNTESGGLTLDEKFVVDFGKEGHILAHEMRFPGGDCTSDIWE